MWRINLVERIKCERNETSMLSSNLVSEITEGVLMAPSSQAKCKVNDLRELGVNTAIDDCGAGLSSRSYFTQFLIGAIKK